MTVIQNKKDLRQAIRQVYLQDETTCLQGLLQHLHRSEAQSQQIDNMARYLVHWVRGKSETSGGIDAFMREYSLSSREGVLLLCLAEALLRIPDAKTADQLIKDKLSKANWLDHLNKSHSAFVNAGTWGLMLTGHIVQLEDSQMADPARFLGSLVTRLSEPVVRAAMKEAMKIISQQFVMADQIEQALVRSRQSEFKACLFSFDMLGEAAVSQPDADRYWRDYSHAIEVLADSVTATGNGAPSISVKLSALHPRYEYSQSQRVVSELVPKLKQLTLQAKQHNVNLTVDAEEADRLELMLDVFELVACSVELTGWNGFGLAVQAYQKRALPVLRWLQALAQELNCRIPVRLVKGAYWDSEIKWAQEQGLEEYPVFTRKEFTDVSYLACARFLVSSDSLYPQFATHNAHTLASVSVMGETVNCEFELQRLHGMGEALYAAYSQLDHDSFKYSVKPCRVYAPVGAHEDLLPYLVRRLLENGANTSFINRISDTRVPQTVLLADPVQCALKQSPEDLIVRPEDLYPQRRNSSGVHLADPMQATAIVAALHRYAGQSWEAGSLIGGQTIGAAFVDVLSPANASHVVGRAYQAADEAVEQAFYTARRAFASWSSTSIEHRAECLERMAELLERQRHELLALLVHEAGKCVRDALAEIREAVDFCRYYAVQLRLQFRPTVLPGVTGELNQLSWYARGVYLCISPWNFPLAIFTGQVAAALAAGNTVVAKPSSQTPLVAKRVTLLFHEAGIPVDVMNLLVATGQQIQTLGLSQTSLAGVAFTGSTETARQINRQLALRPGPLVPLLAETGGINTMIVDSSALVQQVVKDVISSAFNSAGQRCSALRVLFLQEDTADTVLTLLTGAMAQLKLGDPGDISVDVGPVIDAGAKNKIQTHIKHMYRSAKPVFEVTLPQCCEQGHFVAPCVFEIESLAQLQQEIFGPVLHVIRYKQDQLTQLIESINDSGYGLTLGLHSRLDSAMNCVRHKARVGNMYINRNMIGATVGVQPFGGESLSGTGPKAGGPHYLQAFATERVVTVNTAAIGGNTQLLSGISTED